MPPAPVAPRTAHVERELRGYLTCGILAHGFARARCAGCGHNFLIAFITRPDTIGAILTHLGESLAPPPLAPRARAPPEFDLADDGATWSFDQSSRWDLSAPPPDPGFVFNQEPGA